MIRAAIYARFSSDLQSDKSIDDQVALCRDLCAREGMAIISTFEDRAISGSAAINRAGFQSLMRAAEAKLFDVIVAEDLDRVFRDQADYHIARKRLDHLGVAIHTAAGKVGKLDGALRALMSEMFIDNLIVHTRRGLEGVVREGRHAGGRAFGYQPVLGKPGELEIVEAEADIVRRIFAEYIAGKTPRNIALGLNKDRVPAPRGADWTASTINGNYGRGGGILLNDLYAGRLVWDKVRMVKDPATGKRISRPNPKDKYKTAAAPHLRIIDDETFTAAQALKTAKHRESSPKARAPKRVFSGLIKCGSCGGGMSSIGTDKKGLRIQCSAHREAGTCGNGRRIYIEEIETRVLDGLKKELTHPAVIAAYVDEYNAERKRLKRDAGNERSRIERRLGEIERETKRIVDSIAKGMPAEMIAPRARELEAERIDLAGRLEKAKEADNVVTLHPEALVRYKAAVGELAKELARGPADINAASLAVIRELVSEIVVRAAPSRPGGVGSKANAEDDRHVAIDIKGRLAAICGNPAIFPSTVRSGGMVVAGEGLATSSGKKSTESTKLAFGTEGVFYIRVTYVVMTWQDCSLAQLTSEGKERMVAVRDKGGRLLPWCPIP